MPLFVKVIPLRAGTGEAAGEPRLVCCPPDVEPDTVLSFLTQRLGEVIETVWTSTEHHIRLDLGWVFGGAPATGPREPVEFACVPFIEGPGGSLVPMFEVQAGQRRQFAQLGDSRGLDTTVIQQPDRAYHPAAWQAVQDVSTPQAQARPSGELDQRWRPSPGRRAQPCAATPGPATPPAASSCETTATTAAPTTNTPPSNKTAHCGSPATTKAPASASSSAATSPPANGSTWSRPAGSRPWSGSWVATMMVTMFSRF